MEVSTRDFIFQEVFNLCQSNCNWDGQEF